MRLLCMHIYFKLHVQYLLVKCIPWIVWQPTENKHRKSAWVLAEITIISILQMWNVNKWESPIKRTGAWKQPATVHRTIKYYTDTHTITLVRLYFILTNDSTVQIVLVLFDLLCANGSECIRDVYDCTTCWEWAARRFICVFVLSWVCMLMMMAVTLKLQAINVYRTYAKRKPYWN